MTTPLPAGSLPASGPVLPTPPAPLEALDFPAMWLLNNASPSIQYRTINDVLRASPPQSRLGALPFAQTTALTLALTQRHDGVWGGGMLGVPAAKSEHFTGVGTINAVRRLLEYGWDQESPPLVHARRTLFRLLAEDEDPSYLYELTPKGRLDPETARHGRLILREAAAAALAQAGYEKDPRLRGAARRIIERLDAFVRGPFAQKPFIRAGNQHVLAPGAAPPSFHTIVMLAHMPLFRSEHYDTMEKLYAFLSQPKPRAETVALVAKKAVSLPHLVMGDPLPHRNAVEADVPFAFTWLELMARMQFLRRNEGWTKLFERFIDDRDRDGVWRAARNAGSLRSSDPLVWPTWPLESATSEEGRWTDATFRIGLIARLSGRPINPI
ncbi:MAG: hypothetical protein ABJD07_08165 [Gemmatimonadaceae bacterium]